jgi:hypothetical protein
MLADLMANDKTPDGSTSSNRKTNLAALAQRIYPTLSSDFAFKRLFEAVSQKPAPMPVARTIQRFFDGLETNKNSRERICAAIAECSGGRVSADFLANLDDEPAAFATRLDGIYGDSANAPGSFAEVVAGLAAWEQANRRWYNKGRTKLDSIVGAHHVYAAVGVDGALERHILTISNGPDGARATLTRPGKAADYAGVVVENDTFLMMLLMKPEKSEPEAAVCFILLSRRLNDDEFRVGVVCKESSIHPGAYRILVKEGEPGDKPTALAPDDPMYGALKAALSIGRDGPPAVIDADLRQIDALLNGQ